MDSMQEMLEVEPEAVWARLRLGLHHLWSARPQEAISELQAALRMEPANTEAWEALGAAYESVGRLQAALKVYERAVELDDRRVFALTQVLLCPTSVPYFVQDCLGLCAVWFVLRSLQWDRCICIPHSSTVDSRPLAYTHTTCVGTFSVSLRRSNE